MEMTRICGDSDADSTSGSGTGTGSGSGTEKTHSLSATVSDMVCTSNQLISGRNREEIRVGDDSESGSGSNPGANPGANPIPVSVPVRSQSHMSSASSITMQSNTTTTTNATGDGDDMTDIYYNYCNDGNGYAVSHLPVHTSLYIRVPFTVPCSHQRYPHATRRRLKITYLIKGTLIRSSTCKGGRKSVIPFVISKARYIYTGSCLDTWCMNNELAQSSLDMTSNSSHKDTVSVSIPNGSVVGSLNTVVQCNYMCRELDYKLSTFPISDSKLTSFEVIKEKIADSAYWEGLGAKAPEYTPGASVLYRIEQIVCYNCIVRNLSPIILILTDYELLTDCMSGESHSGTSEKQIIQHHTTPTNSNSSIVLCATSHTIIDGPVDDINSMHNDNNNDSDNRENSDNSDNRDRVTVTLTHGEEYSAMFIIKIATIVIVIVIVVVLVVVLDII